MDFDIFGDSKEAGEPGIFPPEIIIKSPSNCMSEREVENSLERVKTLSERAFTCLKAGRNLDSNNVEEFSWAIYLLEQALYHARTLANELEKETPGVRKPLEISEIHSIVTVEQDKISLDLPILVPKRLASQHTSYYSDTLERMLKNIKIPERLKSEKVAIILLHCYKNEHAKWAKRDHDNLEVKWLIDALNNHFFIDDGPFRTSLYHHSTIDLMDHTVVYLVPLEDFPVFLARKIPEWERLKAR